MKKLLLSTALVAATSFGALAQTDGTSIFREAADTQEIRVSDFIGMRVYSAEGEIAAEASGMQDGWEDIGEINDVILSQDGTVRSVLVDIGGFLGIGERQIAIDMNALQFVADVETTGTPEADVDFFLVLNATRADFENAPEWQWQARPDTADRAAAAGQTDGQVMDADPTAGTRPVDGQPAAGTDMAATDPTVPHDGVAGTAAGTWPEGYVEAGREALTVERLTGASVYDAENSRIGSVSDLVLGDAETLTHAIVDVGGFLGIGARPVALDIEQIQIVQSEGGDDLRIYVPMTRDQIEQLPRYEG